MSYIAKSNIIHDGVSFEKGQEVLGLSESQAKRLIADGVLVDSEKTGEEVPEVETPVVTEPKVEEKTDTEIDPKGADTDVATPDGFEDRVVSEQDLLDNPDLAEKGVKVGDTIQVPVAPKKDDLDLSAGL